MIDSLTKPTAFETTKGQPGWWTEMVVAATATITAVSTDNSANMLIPLSLGLLAGIAFVIVFIGVAESFDHLLARKKTIAD